MTTTNILTVDEQKLLREIMNDNYGRGAFLGMCYNAYHTELREYRKEHNLATDAVSMAEVKNIMRSVIKDALMIRLLAKELTNNE